MQIVNSTHQDVDLIFHFYHEATEFQKTRFDVHWPVFDRDMVQTEIDEYRQWKMIENNEVACIWATTDQDPLIWEERNIDPSIYIHRIATNPHFRGRQLVQRIVDWAKNYALEQGKTYVRMDTVGDNKKLIAHYTACGFEMISFGPLKNWSSLPAHYHDAPVCLFEMKI